MIKKILYIVTINLFLLTSHARAGSTISEELSSKPSNTANECFETASRVMFKFNYALDGAVFEPVAKGYRSLPVGFRKGTNNAVNNLRSLLTLTNNMLQGEFKKAGETAGRFAINSTVGILGIFDVRLILGIFELLL